MAGVEGQVGRGSGAGPALGPGHGVAALRAGGAQVVAWDERDPRPRPVPLGPAPTLRNLTPAGALDDVAALITSPGIAHLFPEPQSPDRRRPGLPGCRGTMISGLFFRSVRLGRIGSISTARPRVVAITGSNGKIHPPSALLHHVLRSADKPAQLAGQHRPGRARTSTSAPWMAKVIVLELSSYQTELEPGPQGADPGRGRLQPTCRPITWTGTAPRGGYFAAKRRLFFRRRARTAHDRTSTRSRAGSWPNQLAQGSGDDRVIPDRHLRS